MTGPSAGPEVLVPLGPQPGLHAVAADGPAPDAGLLYEALSGPGTRVLAQSGLQALGAMELGDLDLWLTMTEPGLSRLHLMGRYESKADQEQQRIASRMPLGGFAKHASDGQLAVAALDAPPWPPHGDHPDQVVFHGYGPGGEDLAAHLADRAAVWDEQGRPGAGSLQLDAYPAGTQPEAAKCELLVERPHTVLVPRWPTAAR